MAVWKTNIEYEPYCTVRLVFAESCLRGIVKDNALKIIFLKINCKDIQEVLMTQERDFDRLEQFVSRLLSQFGQLREENKQLENLLVQKEKTITDLRENLSSADSARGDITSRVKGLIEQIEEWEEDLIEHDTTAGVVDTTSAPEVEETVEDEKEGGLQQNLFNV